MHNLQIFKVLFIIYESLEVALIKTDAILMMSAKLSTLGLLKIKVFWNKGYDVITSVHDVTDKILSRESNYIVDVIMWPKFGNSGILWKKLSEHRPEKPIFWWVLLVQVQ